MHWTLQVTYLLALWVGIGALWRPVSAALLAAWSIAQTWYLFTGDIIPIGLYLFTDAAVLLAVWRWRSSVFDLAIAAIFPVMWGAYFMEPEVNQWWTLYVLAMAQFILAGPWILFQKIKGWSDRGPLRKRQWS